MNVEYEGQPIFAEQSESSNSPSSSPSPERSYYLASSAKGGIQQTAKLTFGIKTKQVNQKAILAAIG